MKFFKNDMRNMRKIMKEIFDKNQCDNFSKKHKNVDIFEVSLLQKSSTNFLSMLNQPYHKDSSK